MFDSSILSINTGFTGRLNVSTHLGTQIGVRPKADKKAGGKGDEPDIDSE